MDRAAERHGWIDAVRGAAMLLVVLHHALVWSPAGAFWSAATDILTAVRMPAFFLVSGMLAVGLVRGPGRALVRRRLANLAHLYLLWSVLYAVVFVALAAAHGRSPVRAVTWWTDRSLHLHTYLWFLVALFCYFVVARLVRDVAPAAQIAVSGALAIPFLTGLVHVPSLGGDHIPEYLVFFLIGVNFRRGLLDVAGRVRVRHAVASMAVLAVVVVLRRLDVPVVGAVLAPVAALCGVAAIVAAGVVVAPTRLGRGAAWIGRRTLPIFLLHWAMIGIVSSVGWRSLPPALLHTAGPVLLAAAGVTLSLLVWTATRGWLPWLYTVEPLVARVESVRRYTRRPGPVVARTPDVPCSEPRPVPRGRVVGTPPATEQESRA